MRVLVIGTCRIYGAGALSAGFRRFPHRVHNLPEIERAVDLALGAKLKPDQAHILSMHALSTVVDHPNDFTERLAAEFRELFVSPFDAYVIEHSSAHAYYAQTSAGRVLVDSVVAKTYEQEKAGLAPHYDAGRLLRIEEIIDQRLTPDEIKASMRRIKNRLKAPILWVSHHGLPTPQPSEKHLSLSRATLAAHTARFARQMSTDFHDPTEIVAALGRENAFEKKGADLYHVTKSASSRLSRTLTAWRREKITAAESQLAETA